MVDFIGRFERLNEDFGEICSRIGISTLLPKMNVSNEQSYQVFYHEESIELVRNTFKAEIEMFDYSFEPVSMDR